MINAGGRDRKRRGRRWLGLLLLLLPALMVTRALPAGSAAEPDPRFGIVESFWVPEEAAALNVGWERILFYWREIQPTGPEDWNTLHVREEWLRTAAAQGQPVVGLLKNTPAWATDGASEAGLPRGLYLPLDDPGNLWARFVREIAGYYGARGVHHWIIWNEPEIAPGVFGHEFAGSVADYARLLEVAYLVMKEVDPQAVIHLAGLTWWHDPTYLGELLSLLAADPKAAANNYYFDVISLHVYFKPQTVRDILLAVADIQALHGFDKPVWINETNAPPNLDPSWPVVRPAFQVDLDQQAWFVVQATALGFASGAGSIGVYKLLDINIAPGGESFGLLRPDKTRRPAFDAYRTTIANLRDFSAVGLEETESHYVVSFQRPEGVTRVVWARTPAEVALRLPSWGDAAALFSATGEALDPPPIEGGDYVLTLPGARCLAAPCDIGGAPLFLVERGAVSAALTPAAPFLPTPWSTATPLPSATPLPLPSPQQTPTAPAAVVMPAPSATVTASPMAAGAPTTAAAPDLPSARADLGDTIGLWALGAGFFAALAVALMLRRRESG